MSDENGAIYINITDDEGNEFELEHIDTLELDGKCYMCFLPADMDEDDPDYGFVMLEALTDEETGDGYFGSIDDEELLQRVYDTFLERLYDEDEE